jgi:hypothetical protein
MKSAKQQKKPIDAPERAAWRVREFCDAHRISPSTFWKYQAAGKIKIIRIGGRVLVPAAEAHRIASEGLN